MSGTNGGGDYKHLMMWIAGTLATVVIALSLAFFNSTNTRLMTIEEKFNGKIPVMEAKVEILDARLSRMESKLDRILERIK